MASVDNVVPAVAGWFAGADVGDTPTHLIGVRCGSCGTYAFPPREGHCPNPRCDSAQLDRVPLSRRGVIWSYTENRYAPPPPFVAADPFVPYALAAVTLEAEKLVVLGQVITGVGAEDLHIGMEMEIAQQVLRSDGDTHYTVWVWKPVTASAEAAQ